MRRGWVAGVLGLICLAIVDFDWPRDARAQQAASLQWIWCDDGNPAKLAPAETRYFRKDFKVQRGADEAVLDITADDGFTVWINGVEIGKGDTWKRVYAFDVKKHIVDGKNVIAVQAYNKDGSAGLLARLGYVPNGQSKLAVVSDRSWKSTKTAPAGWEKIDFNDGDWKPARELGAFGKGPWQGITWDSGGSERFAVPPGFKVEMAAKNPNPKDPFSLINMTFDAKGRLLVSQERGPILLCTEPDKDGVFQSVKPYCEQVKGCQGMCWIKDALWLVGDGPDGTGMYKVRDTKGVDRTDEVKLIHKFPRVQVPGYNTAGGMGEHGPHAILHGPDDWIYLVVGNHAWAKPEKLADNSPLTRWPNGQMGPDQGKPGTTEDVLLPRLNDGRGHASNILAPGSTIWRMDHEGKNMSLVAAGFRNIYDAAFSPDGELFTFDSDMEWDEALPWYRAVRICHCPPGADFVWRTGAANTPDYYIDSLPPIAETGRGSPVGLEFYNHYAFPEKYRGALFMGDWSLGIIWAVHLEQSGASYKAKVEKFCQGAPMNVTDLAVGPDGALYFTMGGRGTQGGVYRIVAEKPGSPPTEAAPGKVPQPWSAWAREKWPKETAAFADSAHLVKSDEDASKPVETRAHAVWLHGFHPSKSSAPALVNALKDGDALVRRVACEALIRAGIEPPVEAIYPLLADKDRFVRTAARLVIQRIDPKNWARRLWKEPNDTRAYEGIIALCKTDQASPYAEALFGRLHGIPDPKEPVQSLLDYLRTVQMALIHVAPRPIWVKQIAEQCGKLFPHKDWRVNRELAILLAGLRMEHQLDKPVHTKILKALLDSKSDRQQQIYYFYCMRLLHDGWTPEQKDALLAWYDTTKTWTGGHSFTPFLENILRDMKPIFTADDFNKILAKGEQLPGATLALLNMGPPTPIPAATLGDLYSRLVKVGTVPRGNEVKEAIITSLGLRTNPESEAALRIIADSDPAQRDAVVRSLANFPTPENWPYLVRGLSSSSPLQLLPLINALVKIPTQPKADEPTPYRALLLASTKLEVKDRVKVLALLRHWSNGKKFGYEDSQWKEELSAWSKWFNQAFPKEPALPDVGSDKPPESKYKYEELLAFLDKEPAGMKGDIARGRLVFDKAQCIKCHKYGKDGEGIGPDLTTLSKRFKRVDTLESIYYPSKVISDQYRSTVFLTKTGQQVTGLAAVQGDTITVLQTDGTKVTLKKGEIDQQFASLVSNMPPNLLDTLSKQEIADLFAFLESEPPQ